ncbi:PPOX class F420-dependent oxidoreductase [Tsukamurella soli]|uniref:PPOX class F420-dependent oxidoreductase n=1 Tax=Tsukamurella soli TaxID=644556 RepID=A0ABP8JML7_9ACTN
MTTFRRTGVGVPTPVWVVPLPEGRVGVWTAPDAGKVKRVRNDPHVELTACDARGKVRPGAPTLPGTARLVESGPEIAAVRAALRRKYGLIGTAVQFGSRLKGLFKRDDRVAVLVITPTTE